MFRKLLVFLRILVFIQPLYTMKNTLSGFYPAKSLFSFCFVPSAQRWTLKKDEEKVNKSDFFSFLCPVSGRLTLTSEDNTFHLAPNDFVLVKSETEIQVKPQTLGESTILFFEIDISCPQVQHWADSSSWKIIDKVFKENTLWHFADFDSGVDYLKKIHKELELKELNYTKVVESYFQGLFIEFCRNLVQGAVTDALSKINFEKLVQRLREDLGKHWRLEEMARIAGCGTTKLSVEMKQLTGLSPMNYLIQLRLEEAIHQMQTSKKSLTSIALEMGFYSSQHFSSTFKKVMGKSPQLFRSVV